MTDTQNSQTTWYTGQTYRGVSYSPTWPTWVVGTQGTQTGDSDFANDAFQSFWSNKFKPVPSGDASVPINNHGNYRDDLKTIQTIGFNLVRLYNWDMARGSSSATGPALGHINFLDYAHSLGLKVVVPVSNYFLGDNQYSWNGNTPTSAYDFSSVPTAIKNDFNLFVSSITDPSSNTIHPAIHSISIGNEGDYGQGIAGTTASNFLARTIWWIYNLHLQVNGSGNGPNGQPVINGNSPIVPISATFSNADQGGGDPTNTWFKCLVDGTTANQNTPNGCALGSSFDSAVTGLSSVASNYEHYYYNSINVSQVTMEPPWGNGLATTLALYDNGSSSSWPGAKFDVPLLFMEVFTSNRTAFPKPYDQATAAVNQATTLENYLSELSAGGPLSSTNFMGYNYFEFNDEQQVKLTGLYGYGSPDIEAKTGTTSVWYSPTPYADYTFPVYPLSAIAGPGGNGTLWAALSNAFPSTEMSGSIVAAFGEAGDWKATFYNGSPVPAIIQPGMWVIASDIPSGTFVSSVITEGEPAEPMTIVMTNNSTASTNPFTESTENIQAKFMG